MNQYHDKGYKRLFSNRTIFRQLLETFVDEDWVKEVDFERGDTLDKTYIDPQYRTRESDLIYRLPLRDSAVYIYVLIEFQSSSHRFMALRALNYLTCFYMDLVESTPGLNKLPPVFPIVLYNGDAPWHAPESMAELIERSDLLGSYQVGFRYFKIVENEIDRERLLTASNIVSTLFLAESQYDLSALESKLLDLFDHEPDRQAVSLLLNWFRQWSAHGRMSSEDFDAIERQYTDREEVKTVIETAIARWKAELHDVVKEELRSEVIDEVRNELRNEAKLNIARTMMSKGLDINLIAEITGLTPEDMGGLSAEQSG